MAETQSPEKIGTATVMACPTCLDVLYEIPDGDDSQFRCSNGHSFLLDEICPGIKESLAGLLGLAVEAVTKR